MSEYRVRFEAFEGPMDLLLHLVKKQEVSIYEINLARIASEFVAYLDKMRELDLEVAGEFLVMAATLIYLKSRELLPADLQPAATEEDKDEPDPRWELIRRLVEYRKFKDAAAELQALEGNQAHVFQRRAAAPPAESPAPRRGEVSIFQLVEAVNQVLQRIQARENDQLKIAPDAFTVSEKIESIRRVLGERRVIRFVELFEGVKVRAEVIATFLAMLELARLRQLRIGQTEDFGDIEVAWVDPAEAEAAAPVSPEPAGPEQLALPGVESTTPPPVEPPPAGLN